LPHLTRLLDGAASVRLIGEALGIEAVRAACAAVSRFSISSSCGSATAACRIGEFEVEADHRMQIVAAGAAVPPPLVLGSRRRSCSASLSV